MNMTANVLLCFLIHPRSPTFDVSGGTIPDWGLAAASGPAGAESGTAGVGMLDIEEVIGRSWGEGRGESVGGTAGGPEASGEELGAATGSVEEVAADGAMGEKAMV